MNVATPFASVIIQFLLLEIFVFFDSVLTTFSMASALGIIVNTVAIVVSLMMIFARGISDFIRKRPTINMLVLIFLLLIAATLVADALG
jgi:predicted tellurium resistance membrane protein TerC